MSLDKMMKVYMERREFLRWTGVASLGLTTGSGILGCTAYTMNSSVFENKGSNPNYQGATRTFQGTAQAGSTGTPGNEFYCNSGTPMLASATGLFNRWDTAGRGSGEWVELIHRLDKRGTDIPIFATIYGHISVDEEFKKKYKRLDIVPRGTIVGSVHYWGSAKLMAWEALDINHCYWVDPDNYGIAYNQIDYWDGKTNLEVNNYVERFNRQIKVLETLIKMYKPEDLKNLLQVPSVNCDIKQLHPSVLRKWRILEDLYQKEPNNFQATQEEFNRLKKEFYASQPIVLTIPLNKG